MRVTFGGLLLLAASAGAQDLKLVRNINGSRDGLPAQQAVVTRLTAAGSHALFAGEAWERGVELWRTEGRPGTTRLVADLRVHGSSSPQSFAPAVGRTWFVARDDLHGVELWITDGTQPGTRMVKDLVPGSDSPILRELTPLGSLLLFTAEVGTAVPQLWVSDGTAAGTHLVRAYAGRPQLLVATRGRVFFFADDGVNGTELWTTDGTPAGTAMVADLEPGSAGVVPTRAVADTLRGELVFVAATSRYGNELWRSDGTAAGTRLVADVTPGPGPTLISELQVAGGTIFFIGRQNTSAVMELWRSHDAPAGTTIIRPSASGGPGYPVQLRAVGARVFLFATDGIAGHEPWVSDGTPGGTLRLADTIPGPGGSSARNLAVSGGRVFFDSGSFPLPTLWCSDLTPGGTLPLAPMRIEGLAPRPGGGVVISHLGAGNELWASDGTPHGTIPIGRIGPMAVDRGSRPSDLVTLGTFAVFTADDGVHGTELWRTDGTEAGTGLLADVTPGAAGSGVLGLAALDGGAVFALQTSRGREPWITDGTPTGTLPLAPPTFDLKALRAVGGGRAVFAYFDTAGQEPWITDGTPAGTRRLADLTPGPASSFVDAPIRIDERWFALVTHEPFRRSTLWWSDGTTAGTRAVATLPNQVSATSMLQPPQGTAGRALFRPANAGGRELWGSDGTQAGTVALHFDAGALEVGRDAAWFIDSQRGLWRTDGTVQGTQHALTLPPLAAPSSLGPIALWGSDVLLVDTQGVQARSTLWLTDGSAAGTRILAELPQIALSVRPLGAGRMAIASSTGQDFAALGALWSVDRAGNLARTADRRAPYGTVLPAAELVHGRVLFAADDGVVGSELWVWDPGATAAEVPSGCAGGGRKASLRSGDPRLGTTITVIGEGTPPSAAIAALWLGSPSQPLPRAGPCAFAALPGVLADSFPPASGAWLRALHVPASPRLLGARIILQAAWGPTDGPLGFDLSNGVLLAVGR